MTGFSADWLALREPADAAARSTALTADLLGWRRGREAIAVLDLGSGTGANLRYLAPRLGGRQRWTLADRDAALLAEAAAPNDDVTVASRVVDLAGDLESLDFPAFDLVAASALLDLVSGPWATGLAARLCDAGAAFFAVLSYDGRIAWSPEEALDPIVGDLLNRHQRRDKGFGPALGPAATEHLAGAFESHGYRVATAASPWRLGPQAGALQGALLDGWLAAALEEDVALAAALDDWRARRLAHITAGHSRLEVGHRDLFARP